MAFFKVLQEKMIVDFSNHYLAHIKICLKNFRLKKSIFNLMLVNISVNEVKYMEISKC